MNLNFIQKLCIQFDDFIYASFNTNDYDDALTD